MTWQVKHNCARCGNIAELDEIDFGPFIHQWVCDDCWDAENEAVWTRARDADLT